MQIQPNPLPTPLSSSSSLSSQLFALPSTLPHSSKPLKPKNPSLKSKNIGHWNPAEKELYYIFLLSHRENFIRKELRRTDKIFKEMAKFVKTRAADQCRSHHQKMEKKFVTFDEILESMKDTCGSKDYTLLLKTFESEETKHMMSPQVTGSSAAAGIEEEMGVVEKEEELEFEIGEQPVSFEGVDELELAINSPGLWSDEVIDIDNYFLM